MDKTKDADREKRYESFEDAAAVFQDDDRAPLFETEDDPFEPSVYEENELEYDPEGAFLD